MRARPGSSFPRRRSVAISLLLSPQEAARVRRQLARYEWYRGIYEGFRIRVDELLAKDPTIPLEKGRAFYDSCPEDNAQLLFDPYAPHTHLCPKCGRDWHGEHFDGAWVRQFQGWLPKRLVEAGILYSLEGEERYATYVRKVFHHFIRHYEAYPLANNLLGPTRLFQSTYLEAFWLVDMVAAYDLVRDAPVFSARDHVAVRDLLYASCHIVKSFDEGTSNRQAFNNAGMGAVALLYEDEMLLEHVLDGPHGFHFHLRASLLEDGMWYEGETYHFATLEHLLNLAEMARHRGTDLYGALRPMFDGPLKVMLPDLTFPARKDSWFGRGIGYHKEIYELGYARYGEVRYGGLLAQAYASGTDRHELGWRGFLYLEPELPDLAPRELRPKACEPMPGTGVAVLRRDEGRVYASLEYGHYGGGHGHPDRLHLGLFAEGVLWLLDPGTGWYHVPELGWYRATLAHNTVTVDGHLQTPSEGELTTFGECGGLQVAQARVKGTYPGITMRRTLCLGDGFLFDVFNLQADEGHTYDWVVHTRGRLEPDSNGAPAEVGMRDGYEFLRDATALATPHLDTTATSEGQVLRVVQLGDAQHYRAQALGIPLHEEVPFNTLLARRRAENTHFVTLFLWGEGRAQAQLEAEGLHRYRIEHGGRIHHLELGEQEGLALTTEGAAGLERLVLFARREAALPGASFTADLRLPYGALMRAGTGWRAQLPADFGELYIGLKPAGSIFDLPEGASWYTEENNLILRQAPGIVLERNEPLVLFAGCENTITFRLYAYGLSAVRPEIQPPEGWRLGALQGGPGHWQIKVILPINPQEREGTLSVTVGETTFDLSYRIEAPLAVTWRMSAAAGMPKVILHLRDRTGRGGVVSGEILAPWLLAKPHPFALELSDAAELRLALPLHPLEPAPPLPLSDAWRLDGLEDSAGLYELVAELNFEDFQGVSRARFPLCWAAPEGGDMAGNEVALEQLEQASWAERPWGGAADASAWATLVWNAEGLRLSGEVRDDRHVHDANRDDLYENDSLQIYFDFRVEHARDPNFVPGVAAYILAPAADKRSLRLKAIAGNREISNRGARAPWFTTAGVETTVEPTPDGYRLTAFFPYASLGVAPLREGDVVGFDLSLSDNDGTWYRNTLLVWSGARGRRLYIRGSYHNPAQYGYLIAGRSGS